MCKIPFGTPRTLRTKKEKHMKTYEKKLQELTKRLDHQVTDIGSAGGLN
jgi:hypothetical protein